MGQAYKEYLIKYKTAGSNIIKEITLLRAPNPTKAKQKAIERLGEEGLKNVEIIAIYDRGKIH
jgi:hypothetical protein